MDAKKGNWGTDRIRVTAHTEDTEKLKWDKASGSPANHANGREIGIERLIGKGVTAYAEDTGKFK